jgi:hypothetical protein
VEIGEGMSAQFRAQAAAKFQRRDIPPSLKETAIQECNVEYFDLNILHFVAGSKSNYKNCSFRNSCIFVLDSRLWPLEGHHLRQSHSSHLLSSIRHGKVSRPPTRSNDDTLSLAQAVINVKATNNRLEEKHNHIGHIIILHNQTGIVSET